MQRCRNKNHSELLFRTILYTENIADIDSVSQHFVMNYRMLMYNSIMQVYLLIRSLFKINAFAGQFCGSNCRTVYNLYEIRHEIFRMVLYYSPCDTQLPV